MSQSSRSTFVFGFCLLVVLAVLTYLAGNKRESDIAEARAL